MTENGNVVVKWNLMYPECGDVVGVYMAPADWLKNDKLG